MSTEMSGFLARYDSIGATRQAIARLREAGHEELDVFSPVMSADLEESLGIPSSPVRRWAFIGGITGFVTAVALTGLTSLAYPLVTQGKPILSWPAYFIIMFEMTILFTGLFGFAGVLYHTRRPGRLSAHYRPSFSEHEYGIFVPTGPATESDRRALEALLRESGAVAVEASG